MYCTSYVDMKPRFHHFDPYCRYSSERLTRVLVFSTRPIGPHFLKNATNTYQNHFVTSNVKPLVISKKRNTHDDHVQFWLGGTGGPQDLCEAGSTGVATCGVNGCTCCAAWGGYRTSKLKIGVDNRTFPTYVDDWTDMYICIIYIYIILFYLVLYYIILYYIIWYYTILYYIILYYTILYYIILYYTIYYIYIILYYTILYYIILYYTILYYSILYYIIIYYIILYYTILYYIIL